MADLQKGTLRAQIINIEADPIHKGRTIFSIKFDDDDPILGPWIQAFSILAAERPLTPDEFVKFLKSERIERPMDPFKYLKEMGDKQFYITPESKEPLSEK